jgi:peroxiredoxin
MSKQEVSKATDTRNKPANGKSQAQMSASRPGGASTKNIPNPPGAKMQGSKKQNAAQSRPRALPSKAKKGFRLRPLDIALVLAGVLVVGFIVLSAITVPPVGLNSGATGASSGDHVPVGQPAPDFTAQDVTGKDYTLSAYKGSPVVLEFMATWCPHCQAEAPTYTKLNDTYASKGVQVWGVNATPYGHDEQSKAPVTVDDLKWFKDTFKTSYTLLFDKALKSTSDYGVNSYPSVYIVDKNGNIAYQPPTTALPTYDELAAKLDELLKQ